LQNNFGLCSGVFEQNKSGILEMLVRLKAWWERWQRDENNWQNLDSYFKPVVIRFFISWFAAAPFISSLQIKRAWFDVMPFSWWVLWFASLSYSAAFVLRAVFCPSFIKQHPNAVAYEARGHSPRYIVWQCYNFMREGNDDVA